MSCLKPHQSPASKGGVFYHPHCMVATTGVAGPIKGHETRENIEKRHCVLVKIWRGVRGPILCVTSYFRNEQFGVCLENSFWRTTCFFLNLEPLSWLLWLTFSPGEVTLVPLPEMMKIPTTKAAVLLWSAQQVPKASRSWIVGKGAISYVITWRQNITS